MKHIQILLKDNEYKRLVKEKRNKTWHDFLIKPQLGQTKEKVSLTKKKISSTKEKNSPKYHIYTKRWQHQKW